jgi:hypothetical protein
MKKLKKTEKKRDLNILKRYIKFQLMVSIKIKNKTANNKIDIINDDPNEIDEIDEKQLSIRDNRDTLLNYENKIEQITDKITDKITEKITDKIDSNTYMLKEILSELKNMREDIDHIKSEINNLHKDNKPLIVEVKAEPLNIDDKIVKIALKLNGILGDMMIFKHYYLKNKMCPIKRVNTRHFEYWANNKWNHDNYGKKIIEIISNNLKMTYVKINNINNYEAEQFVENQTHIFDLTSDKYQKKLLDKIVEAIAST